MPVSSTVSNMESPFSSAFTTFARFSASSPLGRAMSLTWAAARNIPLSDMARSTGLEYQTVWWATHQLLHEQQLRAATTRVVNQQHRQWLAAH